MGEGASVSRVNTVSSEDRARLTALTSLDILGTPRERDFDDIVAYVARLCDVPIALISLVGADRQWFKASCGFDSDGTSLDQAICLHALQEETFLEIPDTAADARTRHNKLCQGDAAVRFYAGAVLRLDDGVPVGTLCVLDRRPRQLTDTQRETMELLARQVVRQMQFREALLTQQRLQGEIDHRVKNSLQMVASYLRLQRRGAGGEASDVLSRAEQQVAAIVALHDALNAGGATGTIDLASYLGRIADLLTRTLPANLRIEADFSAAACDGARAGAAAVIVNEFVANSVKHAFPEDRPGLIRLGGTISGGCYKLMLEDDGVGFAGEARLGLGLSIIDAAGRQLGASLDRPASSRGASLVAVFHADSSTRGGAAAAPASAAAG